MNQADIDPSLQAAEPPRESLEDGFSPPAAPGDEMPRAAHVPVPPVLGAKSPF